MPSPDVAVIDLPIYSLLNPADRGAEPRGNCLGFTPAEVRGVNKADRTVTAVVSTGRIDRYGEIVEPSAFRSTVGPFLAGNAPLLAGHQYASDDGSPTVIGSWTELKVTQDGLVGTARFATTRLAEEYWQLYEQGHMKAFSIGFIPRKWEMRSVSVPEGENGTVKKSVRVFTDVELLEISAVAIPANPDALVALGLGLSARAATLDDKTIQAIAERMAEILTPNLEQFLADPDGPLQRDFRDAIAALAGRGRGHGEDDHDGVKESDPPPADPLARLIAGH